MGDEVVFGEYAPGPNTIRLHAGATLGTYAEELIHAWQVRKLAERGITLTDDMIEIFRNVFEHEAAQLMRQMGFTKI